MNVRGSSLQNRIKKEKKLKTQFKSANTYYTHISIKSTTSSIYSPATQTLLKTSSNRYKTSRFPDDIHICVPIL